MSFAELAVIGAGTMGRGIAQIAAQAGLVVRLCDSNEQRLHEARGGLTSLWGKLLDKGKLDADKVQQCERNTTVSTQIAEVCHGADVVVEAIVEQLAVKHAVWREISSAAPADALLGSNTSSIPIAHIASAVQHPERFVGLHFFNPPALVPLLEIVVGPQTSPDTVQRARSFGEQLQRKLVVVKDSPGFATSRLGVVLALEAMRMVEAGVASAEDIDTALEVGYGHAMGPLRTTDLVGLDVRLAIAETLEQTLGGDQYRAPQSLRDMVKAGHLGKKSGQGFYKW